MRVSVALSQSRQTPAEQVSTADRTRSKSVVCGGDASNMPNGKCGEHSDDNSNVRKGGPTKCVPPSSLHLGTQPKWRQPCMRQPPRPSQPLKAPEDTRSVTTNSHAQRKLRQRCFRSRIPDVRMQIFGADICKHDTARSRTCRRRPVWRRH
jgi:hypothetical protein